MEIETRFKKEGETFFVLENGQELTAPTDFYFVTVKDGENELFNRVFDDPIYAGNAVKSLEAFYRCLVQN